jgi:hypothetical protein
VRDVAGDDVEHAAAGVVREVTALSGAEVIEHDDAMAAADQAIDGVGANESSTAGNYRKHTANYTSPVLGSRS